MSLHVSIDFGTSSTCTVASVDGGEPQVVMIDGQPLVPSAVFCAPEGTLFVGPEAERQAAVDPARFEPHPKRRIDEGELLLGDSVVGVPDVVRAVLGRVVAEARRNAGGAAVDLLVVTHPADWGAVRTGALRQAADGLAREVVLVPEPVAAAVFHSAGHGMPDCAALAVLDLGGGTIDASVVHKQSGAFRVLATRGDPNFGGSDIDQLLLEHIGGLVGGADAAGWRKLVSGRDMADRRRRRVLRQDVRGAKETLSRHAYTDVPLPPPFTDAHVTRGDLEGLIHDPLAAAARLLTDTLRAGGVPHDRLAGVFLVGGSSRIPLVSRLVHERTGTVPTTLDQPETVVARGALRAVRLDPARGAGLAPTGDWVGQRAAPVQHAPGAQGRAAQQPQPWAARPQHPAPQRSAPQHAAPGGAAPRRTAGPEPPPERLSDVRTIVIGGSDRTRPVAPTGRSRGGARKLRRGRALAVGAACAVLVVGFAAVFAGVLLTGGAAEAGRYGYGFRQPDRWVVADEVPDARRTVLTPAVREDGVDRLFVEAEQLTYDSTAARDRAVRGVRAQYDRRRAAGEDLSGFSAPASFAGRDVVYFRERRGGPVVEWYQLHEGGTRLRVGCQYTASGRDAVQAACERVVGSLHVR
ncbi:type VII secretion-associated protein [Salinifilum ghardaiensis]